jgi:hypothetical protein
MSATSYVNQRMKILAQDLLTRLDGADKKKKKICTATHFTFVYEIFTGNLNMCRRIKKKIIANGIIES